MNRISELQRNNKAAMTAHFITVAVMLALMVIQAVRGDVSFGYVAVMGVIGAVPVNSRFHTLIAEFSCGGSQYHYRQIFQDSAYIDQHLVFHIIVHSHHKHYGNNKDKHQLIHFRKHAYRIKYGKAYSRQMAHHIRLSVTAPKDKFQDHRHGDLQKKRISLTMKIKETGGQTK